MPGNSPQPTLTDHDRASVEPELPDQGAPLSCQIIAEVASSDPSRPLIQEVGGVNLSYGSFHEEALRWADALRRSGLVRGDRVAVMLPAGADAYIAQAACSWLGGAFVPVSAQLRGSMLVHVLRTSAAKVLLTGTSALEAVSLIGSQVPQLGLIVVVDQMSTPVAGPDLPARTVDRLTWLSNAQPQHSDAPSPGDTQAIVFTSGTSGAAKPVALSFAAMEAFGRHLFPDLGQVWRANAGYYSPWQTSHALGSSGLATAVHRGLRLVVRRTFDPESFWEDIREYDCVLTLLISVGSAVWSRPREPSDAINPLELVAMTPLIPEFREFADRFDVAISSIYGMTEIGPALTVKNPNNHRVAGRPTPGYDCQIVDEADVPVPDGTVGELVVRHAHRTHLMSRYEGQREVTEHAWRNGWFHTGDRFVLHGEDFQFVDRLTDSIRHHGRNISSFEVESEVRAHPAVLACACIGHPAGPSAEESLDQDVRVFVVPKAGQRLSWPELVEFLAPRMPRYSLPRYFEEVAELPMNASGRVTKAPLRGRDLSARTWDRKRIESMQATEDLDPSRFPTN
jgi:crotonobetaine/carnitine-CoA ligase